MVIAEGMRYSRSLVSVHLSANNMNEVRILQ